MPDKAEQQEQEFDQKLATALHEYKESYGLDPRKGREIRSFGAVGKAMRVSIEFFSAIVVGTCFGMGVDWLFASEPVGLMVFLVLGVFGGMYNIYKYIRSEDSV